MDLSSRRKARLAWILGRMREARSASLTIEKDKLVSAACIEFGAGNRYIKDLIQDLLNIETLVESDGKLYFKDQFLAELKVEDPKG